MKNQICLYIYGPTAVGKTEFVDTLAAEVPLEVINLDMGQCYEPLSIGTAKPDWQHAAVPHHLFDVVRDPVALTVVKYRQLFMEACQQIWARGKLPVAVGGSGFYLRSLLFPPVFRLRFPATPDTVANPTSLSSPDEPADKKSSACPPFVSDKWRANSLWDELYAIDPVRAQALGKKDHYRIQRALDLWHETGVLPSACAPVYDPPCDYVLVNLMRERSDLYRRVDERVVAMMRDGWIEEVRRLMGTSWQSWLTEKKIIGYDDIVHAIAKGHESDPALVKVIQQRTRNYAKRQISYGRMLERQLISQMVSNEKERKIPHKIIQANLTSAQWPLYSVRIKKQLAALVSQESYEKSS